MRTIYTFILFTLLLALIVGAGVYSIQTAEQVLAQISGEDIIAQREAQLRAELEQVLKEIAEQQQILQTKQREGVSLERDIAILNAEIAKAKLRIRAHNISIEGLGKDINKKTQTIKTLEEKIENSKESLAQLIRKTNEIDSYSLVEVVFGNEDISDFFIDLDSFDSIKESMRISFAQIRQTRSATETEKQSLDRKRLQEVDAKVSVEAEKRKIENAEAEKKRLLGLSKKEQENYKNNIKSKEAKAAQIRSALFSLRDSAAIPFGKALEYANTASAKTGVRPAFLLAILTQESDLGKNVGTCNRPGDPETKSWRNIMKPTRDHEPYLRITSELGLNPDTMPLSCRIGNVGWGGAMGPAQFIPSTWELMKSRVGAALGKLIPNPWDPQDAFMASAIYLSDLGAGAGGYSAERNAACRYYSGRSCDSKTPANTFYGNGVMQKATNIQENMIDPLMGL